MLACKAADVIAAVAPVDFRCVTGEQPSNPSSLTATNNTACTCKLPRPISVMAFDEGQDMSIVPYNGGKTVVAADCAPGGSCATFNFPGAQLNIDTWANSDMCTGFAATDSMNSICKTYSSCGGGATDLKTPGLVLSTCSGQSTMARSACASALPATSRRLARRR